MRNIFLLTKNYFLCAIGSLRSKKSRLKSSLGIFLIITIYAAFFAFLQYSQIENVKMYAPYNLQKTVLGLGFLMGIFLAIVFAFQRITGGQKANDTELLLAMPFKKSEIMIAKAVSRYLFNFVLVFLLVMPSIIAYMLYTPFTIVALLGNIIVLLLIPLIAVGISYIVDFITAFCFPNSRFGNIVKAIFTLVILICGLGVYEYITMNIEVNSINIFVDYIITFNPIFILSLVAISFALFFLGIWLFSITMNHETKSSKSKAVSLSAKSTTPFRSLMKNEVNRYLNSTVLMINTLIGPIGIVALTIWIIIDKCQTLAVFCALMEMPTDCSYLLIALVYSSLVIMTYPAAFSISLEGKQLWIIKTMPVKVTTVFLAKSLFNVLLVTPVLVICAILLGIIVKMPFMFVLTVLLLPVLLNLIVSFGGLFVNLLFPKFEYESDAAVVKQSISSVIMMLGGMITVVLLFVLYLNLLDTALSMTTILLIPLLILFAVALILILLTFTIGKRIFNKL